MNNTIFYFLYDFAHQSFFLDYLIVFFATYFQYIVITLAVIFLLTHHEVLFSSSPIKELKQKWREIIMVFFSGVLAWILSVVFKIFFQTQRPFELLGGVNPLFSPTDYAFPSGHATFFFALAITLFFSHKKIGILFFIFASIISIARIMAGVHFPIDIFGGFILGFIISFIIKSLNKI